MNLDTSEKAKERKEALEKEFKPLTDWLKDEALKDKVSFLWRFELFLQSQRFHIQAIIVSLNHY